jgi:hypothetical protein
MNKLFLLMPAALLAAATFTSCSDDDSNDSNASNGYNKGLILRKCRSL